MKLEDSFHKSPKNAYAIHWIWSGVTFLIELIILGALYSMWNYFNWYHFIFYILIFLFVLSCLRLVIQPYVRYRFHYYSVDAKNVEVKSMFIFKHHQMTKIERLQYLQIKTNPLLKAFHLNTVVFVTAGHEVKLPLMSEVQAEYLSQHILEALRGADSDV
ncbi:PH domain-containing protein [Staphylococcus croceilyticus]|uniref:PH domain-containing protein n=1 Tax=Staphylococcus croceilyticus TaxID=319942 RepID=A0ABY2KC46_9STAP|nr:PH domain-containing protein [Staphylococcus croceilyticus]PNZ66790.1 hypothetical protein CD128_09525 [Staphylococcus croceilyticus]TGA73100.1 PH domain-containing protein [Staphylococcus croceilyticus]